MRWWYINLILFHKPRSIVIVLTSTVMAWAIGQRKIFPKLFAVYYDKLNLYPTNQRVCNLHASIWAFACLKMFHLRMLHPFRRLSWYPAWIRESFIRFWQLASCDKDGWIRRRLVGLHDAVRQTKPKQSFPPDLSTSCCSWWEAKRTHCVTVSRFSFAADSFCFWLYIM